MNFRVTSARRGPVPARLTTWTAALAATALVGTGFVATSAAAEPVRERTSSTSAVAEPVTSTLLAAAGDLPGAAQQIALTDENLFVQTGTGSAALTRWRPRSGGTWSTTWGGRALAGELIAAENDVVHLRTTQGETLTWTRDHDGDGTGGGSRAVPDGSVLGHGAEGVAYADGAAHAQAVESAGDVWTSSWGRAGVAVYGDHVVTAAAQTDGFTFARQNFRKTEFNAAPMRCTNGSDEQTRVVDANERFALARCADGQVWLQDNAEVYYPFALSSSYAAEGLRLGAGFVLGADSGTGELVVTPLADDARGSLGTASDVDLDDAGSTAAFVDPAGDVRAADLSGWSSQMRTMPEETTPPYGNAWPPTTAVVTTTSYWIRLSGGDRDNAPDYFPSNMARIESEYRLRAKGATEPGMWTPGPTAEASAQPSTQRRLSESFMLKTPAPGTQVCWRARGTDAAGNVGQWTEQPCFVVDSTAPTTTGAQLPPSTKATATSTKITFRYQATDNGKVASYDVRWRRTPRGGETSAWVYPKSYQGTTATSASAYSMKSTITCFQARARDVLGNVSGWSPVRCTYVDGTRPTIRWTSYPRWVTPSQTWWSTAERTMISKPTYRYSASDERGVVGYEVQRRLSSGNETRPWVPRAFLGTRVSFKLYTGEQNCNRVRARDQADNWSAWSSWKCTNMPFSKYDTSVHGGHETGRYSWALDAGSGAVESQNDHAAVAIRAKFVTGPTGGAVRVTVRGTSLGVVHTWAPEPGTKWVTLRASERITGYFSFTKTGDWWREVHLREFYAIR